MLNKCCNIIATIIYPLLFQECIIKSFRFVESTSFRYTTFCKYSTDFFMAQYDSQNIGEVPERVIIK